MKISLRNCLVFICLVVPIILYSQEYDPQKYEGITLSETYDFINSNVNDKIKDAFTFNIDQNGICRMSLKMKAYTLRYIDSEIEKQIIEEIKKVTNYSNRKREFYEFTVNDEIKKVINNSYCDVVYYYSFDTADLPDVSIENGKYNEGFYFGYNHRSERKKNFVKEETKYNFNTFGINNWDEYSSLGSLFESTYLKDSDYSKIKSSIKKICEKESVQYDYRTIVTMFPKYTSKDKILKAFKHIVYLNKEKREAKEKEQQRIKTEEENKRKRKETLFD